MNGQKTLDENEVLVLECLVTCGYPLSTSTMVFYLVGKTDVVNYWRDFDKLLTQMQRKDLIETAERQVCDPYSRTRYTFTKQGLTELNCYREKPKVNS